MRLFSIVAAAALAVAIATGAQAQGLFPGLPNATTITGNECIPADTRLAQGLTPATECISPGQINGAAAFNPLNQYSNIPIGSVAYGSLGTNTTDVAGQLWVVSVTLPVDMTITSLRCLAGGTATTDNVIGALYKQNLTGDTTMATLVANSALAGVLLAGANTFQTYTFLSTYAAKAGKYFMVLQGNGTTAGAIRTIAASTFIGVTAGSIAGVFGTIPSMITFPTTFTADKGPICWVQ